ncbi:AAA family ATPase [Desulfuromonas acetoxidans]|uniref:AAA family ATPase n=1 Tax=Desulfuromonas acetoxidans TaxID=891 RepID=UPI00292CB0C9|nr:AAA family ATPase [Desulfuromonas acetoxidans]
MSEALHVSPIYQHYPIQDFNGNPLIEALRPPACDPDEAILRLVQKPPFAAEERELPPVYRSILPHRLVNFFFPQEHHVRLLQNIHIQLLDGYRKRNPMTAAGQRLLYSAGERGAEVLKTPAKISFVTGMTGMGKSTAIRAILKSLGSPVLKHSNYRGQPFPETQILYLMRNVSPRDSAKSVCRSLLEFCGELLSTDNFLSIMKGNRTGAQYVTLLKKIIANYHVGMLVIDEFQNLSLASSGGKAELLSMVINLRDELGVPIILVGNYKAASLFRSDPSAARRLIEGGFHEIKRPETHLAPEWKCFCEILWKYQWVREPKELTEEIVEGLYDCCQGITGIAVNVFVKSQEEAILNGVESLTASYIREIFVKHFVPIHGIVDILSSNDPSVISEYEDLYFSCINKFKFDPLQEKINALSKVLNEKSQEQIAAINSPQKRKGTGKKAISGDILKEFVLGGATTSELDEIMDALS